MSELTFLLDAAARLRQDGEAFLIATVVRVSGSSYRRPGARMLLTEDRWVAGSVSGGCLEGDVLKKGWWRTREGGPALCTYDSTSRDEIRWGFGLGCDGVVDVLLERADRAGQVDPLAFLEQCRRTQTRGALVTIFRSEAKKAPAGTRLALYADGRIEADEMAAPLRDALSKDARIAIETGESTAHSYPIGEGSIDALVEAVLPPTRLFVFGAGHDAVAVVQIAHTLGWETHICEPHARWVTRERFAMADHVHFVPPQESAALIEGSECPTAVVMGHNYEQDRDYLAMLLGTRARYIGALGPRRRTARMLGEIGKISALDDSRLHAPIGLAIGAETPQEIALAVLAEVKSVLTRTSATSLREQRSPIHQGNQAIGHSQDSSFPMAPGQRKDHDAAAAPIAAAG